MVNGRGKGAIFDGWGMREKEEDEKGWDRIRRYGMDQSGGGILIRKLILSGSFPY